MSAPSSCCNPCEPTTVVEVPGVQGAPGAAGTNGTDGVDAFTVTTADFTVPAIAANVTVLVADSTWAAVGQNVFIVGAGYFSVVSKPAATSMTLTYLNYTGNTFTGINIVTGAQVSVGGLQKPLAVALPTVLTDNSTGTQSNTIAAGVGVHTVTIPLTSLATGLGAAAIDLLTNYVPGYRFKVLKFDFITTVAGTGAGASQVFNLEIGATNVTGGVLTVLLAGTATIGVQTNGTAITALNIGTNTDTLSIEMAAGGTVFTAGAGYFVIAVQNMDEADAVASLAKHVNDLIASLT